VSNTEPDWATHLVDTFESAVGSVRAKTSEPATKFVKYAVFAVMASGLLLLLVAFLIIGLVRLADNYLPWGVWLAYFVIGSVFLLAGSWLWRKRRATQPTPH
jgi:membrane protein DedA with SNARE-associated domain